MNIEPNDLMLFVHVVDDGSFTQAALRMGLLKAAVSRPATGLTPGRSSMSWTK